MSDVAYEILPKCTVTRSLNDDTSTVLSRSTTIVFCTMHDREPHIAPVWFVTYSNKILVGKDMFHQYKQLMHNKYQDLKINRFVESIEYMTVLILAIVITLIPRDTTQGEPMIYTRGNSPYRNMPQKINSEKGGKE